MAGYSANKFKLFTSPHFSTVFLIQDGGLTGNLKLDFMAKSIGIHFFEFEDMFRCHRDNENLKKHFGHMDT